MVLSPYGHMAVIIYFHNIKQPMNYNAITENNDEIPHKLLKKICAVVLEINISTR